MKVLIAGLAGASLGTEILKCLSKSGRYEVYGCDISQLAYGLYSDTLVASFLADRDDYVNSIIGICLSNQIEYIIPGGEEPMVLLAKSYKELSSKGIILVCNTPAVIELFNDKKKTFDFLKSHSIDIPKTVDIDGSDYDLLDQFEFPCIVKPSLGTGGSDSVFLATNKDECIMYSELLIKNNKKVIIQEYIDVEAGEFTIGVLSGLEGNIISSVAMKRVFNSKLSVAYRGTGGVISSGYSQGLIADFPELRDQAERIAILANSIGPINIQGRVKDGILFPFEINPRFSASTYLRAMAGINEIDIYLQHLSGQSFNKPMEIRPGYYLRSFDEIFIDAEDKRFLKGQDK